MKTLKSLPPRVVFAISWIILAAGCTSVSPEKSASQKVEAISTTLPESAAANIRKERAAAASSMQNCDPKVAAKEGGPKGDGKMRAEVAPTNKEADVVKLEAFTVASVGSSAGPTAAMSAPTAPETTVANPNITSDKNFQQVRVFYATDRRATGTGTFDGRRNPSGSPLSYGTLFVSIPREHQFGEIEKRGFFNRLFGASPDEEMRILRRLPKSEKEFYDAIRAALPRGENSTFVFVHGFNVSFDDAALRTAQIAYDLDYTGVPVFYSWPSQGEVADYVADYENADWARANLKKFLLEYARTSASTEIYLIAHSMGNRVLTYALRDLYVENPALSGRFREIILAAPDVDEAIFRRDVADVLIANCRQITLYVSKEDKALELSKSLRSDYPRLGDSRTKIALFKGIETIDVSGLDTSFLKHSYFAQNTLVRQDISQIVKEHLRAAFRKALDEVTLSATEVYWQFVAPKP